MEGNELDYVHSNASPSTTMTYNENFIFAEETATTAKKLRFDAAILHEIAHMWFGSLIAISWWNTVGLNESVATWVAFYAMS